MGQIRVWDALSWTDRETLMLVWDLGGWGGEGFSLRRPGPGRRGMGCGDLVESFWPLKASTFQDTPGSGMGGEGYHPDP